MEAQLSIEQRLRIWLIEKGKNLTWLAVTLGISVQRLEYHLHKPERLSFPPRLAMQIEEITGGKIGAMELMLRRIPPTGTPGQEQEPATTA